MKKKRCVSGKSGAMLGKNSVEVEPVKRRWRGVREKRKWDWSETGKKKCIGHKSDAPVEKVGEEDEPVRRE